MDARGIGLLLIWTAAVPLLAVLVVRIRKGMWQNEALEAPPPVPVWLVPLAGLGLVLALAGVVLVVRSLL